ncbi:MAG: hypothetical protein II754_04700, partial [Lachnospiraceae bacterium]|nr:hypothetical protein [Lachnospiraceae bacterium]
MSSTVARPKVKSVPSEAMVKTKRKPISKKKLFGRAVLIALVLSACAGLAAYLCFSLYYTRHFFPKTMVNGIDASNQEVFEVREKIADEIEDYQLTVITKDGEEQVINGADIGLKAVFGDELVSLLASQNGLTWPAHVNEWEEKTVGTMVDWSADGLTEALSSLPCVQKENMVAPADAYLSDYTPGTGYTVVPEVEGSTINFDDLRYYAEKKIPVLEETLDLRDVDVYVKPTVYSADETLNRRAEALNRYVTHTITYDMGENSMKLDGSRINDWITVT